MNPITQYNDFREQVLKVFWITLFWILVSIMQFLLTYSASAQLGLYLTDIQSIGIFKTSLITGLVAGIFGGSTMVFFWEKWLRSMSYRWSLVHIFWSYTLIYLMVSTIGRLYFHSGSLKLPFFDQQVLDAFISNNFSFNQAVNFVFWLGVVIFTLIALLVNDKYGPGVFVSFLLGKYFQPKREERVFMFLDLRASTVIAEKLGERRYFNFLKDLYRDITPGILRAKGEIYQYVGDEVVVSWKQPSGVQANCIQCFFEICKILSEKASYYLGRYDGLQPEFKAGLHTGHAMVGEIGIVKREIAYSGDVLNTTARIQAKCNELGVNILISSHLLERIIPMPDNFQAKALGAMELRGKSSAVQIYTVQEIEA